MIFRSYSHFRPSEQGAKSTGNHAYEVESSQGVLRVLYPRDKHHTNTDTSTRIKCDREQNKSWKQTKRAGIYPPFPVRRLDTVLLDYKVCGTEPRISGSVSIDPHWPPDTRAHTRTHTRTSTRSRTGQRWHREGPREGIRSPSQPEPARPLAKRALVRARIRARATVPVPVPVPVLVLALPLALALELDRRPVLLASEVPETLAGTSLPHARSGTCTRMGSIPAEDPSSTENPPRTVSWTWICTLT